MTEAMVQAQVLEFLVKSTHKGPHFFPNDQQVKSFTGTLPALTPHQVRALCKSQEQNVSHPLCRYWRES